MEQDEFISAVLDFMEFCDKSTLTRLSRRTLMKGLLALEEEKIGFVNLKPIFDFTFGKFHRNSTGIIGWSSRIVILWRWLQMADEDKMPWLKYYI